MNNHNNLPERAVALVNESIDVLQRADRAPDSPVNTFLVAEQRRHFRRAARRLRDGLARPRFANLRTAEELAEVYERTVRRDEILEESGREFRRITFELGRVLEQHDPEVEKALDALIDDMKRSAEENGPGSEASQRYRQLQMLGWVARHYHSQRRRRRERTPLRVPLASDPSIEARDQRSAAELLPSPPTAEETVIAIPPEGIDSGRERIFLRIGVGEASWIGSFERGHRRACTIYMMPGDERLFVSAAGVGYIIDAKSRTLVETIGTDVAGVMRNEPNTLFVVNHKNRYLEAFGKSGRLWKTERISAGGLHCMAMTDHELIGQARHPLRGRWVGFSVSIATGEVRFEGGR